MKEERDFRNLTEGQMENLLEFAEVSARCSKEVLEALEEQVPVTYELFRKCMEELGTVGAIGALTEMMGRYPDYGKRYNEEEGWGPEKAESDFRKIMEKLGETK
ncbi:hypothetical protein B5E84_10910 [Lachnoclostridium sp. An14]|uniref:hypothetical protein n=1 Tax=Lachnoclostridium sp. An14 TaxID=1965562 RepID=UPI000B391219|nr:hypothetical protein [Lachnoclostridium sp. An14]OUQ16964.1 hypothetical protein B5E84_10910 [Lachnoclostridium sp. An14]